MWRKDEPKSQGAPEVTSQGIAGNPPPSGTPSAGTSSSAALPISPKAAACITQGIRIKGDITGKEDLFVDGTLEGKLDLGGGVCTIGPNGKVKADIAAREVIVRGDVEGKIDATEKMQVWSSGRVNGEVRTGRLAIEDGALLRGKVEAGKPVGQGSSKVAGGSASVAAEKAKGGNTEPSSRAAVI